MASTRIAKTGKLTRPSKGRVRGQGGRFTRPGTQSAGNTDKSHSRHWSIYDIPDDSPPPPEPVVAEHTVPLVDTPISPPTTGVDEIDTGSRGLPQRSAEIPSPPSAPREDRGEDGGEDGGENEPVVQHKSRRPKGIKSRTVCYPRVTYPAPEAAERRARWQRRWGVKPQNPKTIEEKLRSTFWGNGDARPRCYSCKVSQARLATGEDGPDGTEERDLLPCGCLYEASLLEMWCVKKGLFADAEAERAEREKAGLWVEHLGPKTFGKHKMLLLRFWEMMFGPFDFDTLINYRGRREAKLIEFNNEEERAGTYLSPNTGYLRRAEMKRKRKERFLQ